MASLPEFSVPDDGHFPDVVARMRSLVDAHLAAGGQVADLGICERRPENLSDFAFVGIAPPKQSAGDFYRCSYCQTDRKFKSGRIVLSQADRKMRLIGDDCHARHLDPEAFSAASEDYRQHQRRRAFELVREQVAPAARELWKGLAALLKMHGDALQRFESPLLPEGVCPGLRAMLVEAARSQGNLHVERLVNVEPVSTARAQDETRDAPRRAWRRETVHRLIGTGLFLARRQTLLDLRDAIDAVNQITNTIQETDWETASNRLADSRLRGIVGAGQDIHRLLFSVRSEVATLQAFFSRSNLGGLLRWASDADCPLVFHDCTIEPWETGFLVHERSDRIAILPPVELDRLAVPDPSPLTRLLERIF